MVCDSIGFVKCDIDLSSFFSFYKNSSSLTVIFPVSTLNRPPQIPYIQCTTVRVVSPLERL